MKLGSLFDGIGGFPLAAIGHNIKPVWASEIEPFPVKVTEKHFPEMKHLGNITQINGAEIEPVDIITFGSPCQDLSVAGKREGLQGERSHLFFEAIRIIKEMRDLTNGQSPRFAIWENVPGALSSNKGEDFKEVVQSFIEIGALDISWRIFDAQYFGVPQRRRRIFLVADFGGQRAGEILFEPEGLPWNFTEGRKKGEEVTRDTGESTKEGCGIIPFDITQITSPQNGSNPKPGSPCHPLCANAHVPAIVQPVLFEPRSPDGVPRIHESGICPTLNTAQGGGLTPCIAYGISSYNSNSMKSSNPNSGIYKAETSKTLDMNGGNPACNQGGIAVVVTDKEYAYCLQGNMIGRKDENGPQGSGINEDVSFTLNITDRHAVAYGEGSFGQYVENKVSTLKSSSGCLGGGSETLINDYAVRRLTPIECLRLQGFPDYWLSGLSVENPSKEDISFWLEVFETHRQALFPEKKPKTEKQIITWLKRPYSDTAAYKAIGNSLAVPVVDWIFKRLREVVNWGLVDD